MNKDVLIIGFMLFSLFFGAGNLIYPPILGIESGTSYWIAMSGFILTGVGLPVLTVTAISFVKSDARELADRVHPLFGLIFTSVAYLTIGPLFGIPRAATVAYEMGVLPFTESASSLILFIFTITFFALVFWVSLNPSKMVDRIGQYLTPILIIAIIVLSIGSIFLLNNPLTAPIERYAVTPFFTGFSEGYLTMDAIGALAFGIIVINAFKERGISSQENLIKSTLKAGFVAGIALVVIYILIGLIGTKMAAYQPFRNGGEILSSAASMIYGNFGTILLGLIVILACFTTTVGLVTACGQFFAKITGMSYPVIILIVTIGGLIVSNQGLDLIISLSAPVLTFIYPITIVLILLTFLYPFLKRSTYIYRGAILATAIISLHSSLNSFDVTIPTITNLINMLPFTAIGLGWLIPACIGGIIGKLLTPAK
jgi:LIVCS family branched-chain amino acid:cation transporter